MVERWQGFFHSFISFFHSSSSAKTRSCFSLSPLQTLVVLQRSAPVIPISCRRHRVEKPLKPWLLTSTGPVTVFQLASLHLVASTDYFAFFHSLATSSPSCQGTVTPTRRTVLLALDYIKMSGLSVDGSLHWKMEQPLEIYPGQATGVLLHCW